MNVSKQIEEIIMDNVILGVDSGQAYFRDADQAVEKITTLLQTICLTAKPSRADSDKYFDAPPPLKVEDGSELHHVTHQPSARDGYNQAISDYEENLTRLLKGEDDETN